jgi:hypothetical protein
LLGTNNALVLFAQSFPRADACEVMNTSTGGFLYGIFAARISPRGQLRIEPPTVGELRMFIKETADAFWTTPEGEYQRPAEKSDNNETVFSIEQVLGSVRDWGLRNGRHIQVGIFQETPATPHPQDHELDLPEIFGPQPLMNNAGINGSSLEIIWIVSRLITLVSACLLISAV